MDFIEESGAYRAGSQGNPFQTEAVKMATAWWSVVIFSGKIDRVCL